MVTGAVLAVAVMRGCTKLPPIAEQSLVLLVTTTDGVPSVGALVSVVRKGGADVVPPFLSTDEHFMRLADTADTNAEGRATVVVKTPVDVTPGVVPTIEALSADRLTGEVFLVRISDSGAEGTVELPLEQGQAICDGMFCVTVDEIAQQPSVVTDSDGRVLYRGTSSIRPRQQSE